MGVDRTLFISGTWGLEHVVDVLKSLKEVSKLEVRHTTSYDYTIVNFRYEGDEDWRQLSFHRSTQRGGFTGNLLTLGAWGHSEDIFTTIAERLGGFYEHSDCEGTMKAYDYAAASNLDFMLKHSIIRGKCDGRELDQFVKDHNEVSAGWKKTHSKVN